MRQLNIILCLCLALTSFTGVAAFPPAFEAIYKLDKFGMSAAETVISLKQNPDGSWTYQSETEPKGLIAIFRDDHITEKSVMKDIDGLIRPVDFRYIHRGSKKDRDMHFVFDWKNRMSANTVKGQTSESMLLDQTIDKFSMQLRMMDDLHSGRRELQYHIIDKGKLRDYEFIVLGSENIETPAGKFTAIKLKRDRDDDERTTLMWVAPELHFLPVRIQHIDKEGSDFSLYLDRVKGPITGDRQFPSGQDAD